jgi:hypothetical protein
VAFPNSDEIRHNVYSPEHKNKPGPPAFNLGTYPQHETKYHVFDTPGVTTLLCNVHAEMSAYVVAAETPYFAVTGKDGKFTLKNVPPGQYTILVWHERLKDFTKPANVRVDVGEGATVTVPPIELKR